MDRHVPRRRTVVRSTGARLPWRSLLLVATVLALVVLAYVLIRLPSDAGPVAGTWQVNQYPFQAFRAARLASAQQAATPSATGPITFALSHVGGERYSLEAVATTRDVLSSAQAQTDINANGTPETYVFSQGQLAIYEGDVALWQSQSDWWVDSYSVADATGDGKLDLALSVWKEGDYGPSKPFWVTQNDMSTRNHLFVYSYDAPTAKIVPVWQSSNLDAPNCDAAFADVDSDGKQELVVVEGSYDAWPECKGQYVAVWSWNGWGFANDWRSETGAYNHLVANGSDVVVVRQ